MSKLWKDHAPLRVTYMIMRDCLEDSTAWNSREMRSKFVSMKRIHRVAKLPMSHCKIVLRCPLSLFEESDTYDHLDVFNL